MNVRTTLTLDDDVAAKLRAETRRSGRSFKEAVNEALRLGLSVKQPKRTKPFAVRDIGLRLGLEFESTSELMERLDGVSHR